jgi:hypothetical protein
MIPINIMRDDLSSFKKDSVKVILGLNQTNLRKPFVD